MKTPVMSGGIGRKEPGEILVVNFSTGKQLSKLSGHKGGINNLCFSVDNRFLFGACNDASVYVWDLNANTRPAICLVKHNDAVQTIVLLNDESLLASGSLDGTVKVTNIKNQVINKETKLPASVMALAVAPGNQFIAAGLGNGHIVIWDYKNNKLINTLQPKGGMVFSLAFTPNGKELVSGSENGELLCWKGIIWQESAKLPTKLNGHIHDIVIDNKGCIMIACGVRAGANGDGAVELWDLNKRSQTGIISSNGTSTVCLSLSRNNKILASAGVDQFGPDEIGSVKIWDLSK